jgi:hypothetical protein
MDENTDNTEEKQKPQLYKPGQSGNPNGRPKGTKNYLTLLEDAIKQYETDNGKSLFSRFVERAFKDDRVLIEAMKKFLPNMEKIEHTGAEPIEITIKHESTS